MKGIVAGVLALTFLQAAVSSKAAASRTGGLFTGLAVGVRYLVDPTVPLIPDRRNR